MLKGSCWLDSRFFGEAILYAKPIIVKGDNMFSNRNMRVEIITVFFLKEITPKQLMD